MDFGLTIQKAVVATGLVMAGLTPLGAEELVGAPSATGSLWQILGFGMVLVLAYGASWLVVRPVVNAGEGPGHRQQALIENSGMRALLDDVEAPLLLADTEGRPLWLNRSMRNWLADETPVLPGRHLTREARQGQLGAELKLALARDEEVVGRDPVGGWRQHSRPVWGQGELQGVIAIFKADQGEAAGNVPGGGALAVGPLSLDLLRRTAFCHGGRLHLTATEFKLLAHLAEHRGQIWKRPALLEAVWGHKSAGASRTVDTHIRRLREKLGDGSHLIETVRGQGYRLRGDDE